MCVAGACACAFACSCAFAFAGANTMIGLNEAPTAISGGLLFDCRKPLFCLV